MIVGRRMTRDPKTVGPDDSLARAAGIMREFRIHHLPVVSDGGRLVGILSDTDVRNASLAAGEAHLAAEDFLAARRVREIMKTEVWSLTPEASVEDALQILCRSRFGALPVLSADRLVGIITRGDLLRAFADVLNLGDVCACLDVALPPDLSGFEALVAAALETGGGVRSVTIVPHKASDRMIARLRLSTLETRRVVQTLRERGYDVRELPDAI